MTSEIKSIFLIGAAKSGTTTLFDLLTKHPEICRGVRKESEYFTDKRGDLSLKKQSFFDLFQLNTAMHKFIIDASTGYSMCHIEPNVPQKIKDYGLDPLIIYIVRNPIERMISHYNFARSTNLEWKGKLDGNHLIQTSMYFKQLQAYEKVFGREKILILDFDSLTKNPKEVCNQVFRFIKASEFEFTIPLENHILNKTKPKNPTKLWLTTKLRFVKGLMPDQAVEVGSSILDKFFKSKKYIFSESQLAEVKSSLSEDMRLFKEHYQFPVEKWGF